MNAIFTGSLIIIFPVLFNNQAGAEKKTISKNRASSDEGMCKLGIPRITDRFASYNLKIDTIPVNHTIKVAAHSGSLKDSIEQLSRSRNSLYAALRSKDSLIKVMRSRDSLQTNLKKKDFVQSSASIRRPIQAASVVKDSVEAVSNLRQAVVGSHKAPLNQTSKTKDSLAVEGEPSDPMQMSLSIEKVQVATNSSSFNLKPAANETKGSFENEPEKTPSTLSTPPVFPKGEAVMKSKLKDYVKNHYPSLAKKNDTEGTVVVSFFVEKDGTIDKIRVFSGLELNFDLPETAVKAIKSLKKFKPATENGLPISANVNVPVEFRF